VGPCFHHFPDFEQQGAVFAESPPAEFDESEQQDLPVAGVAALLTVAALSWVSRKTTRDNAARRMMREMYLIHFGFGFG
jgi:hypothetical protein